MSDGSLMSDFKDRLKPNMGQDNAYFFTYDSLEPRIILTANNNKQHNGREE